MNAAQARARKKRVEPKGTEQRTTTDRRLPGFDVAHLDGLGLSRRELAVLERVAEGRTNEEIAEALGLSPLTVKKHLERMSVKLGAANRAALVALAWQRAASPAVPPKPRRSADGPERSRSSAI